jgi:hypothetical protein
MHMPHGMSQRCLARAAAWALYFSFLACGGDSAERQSATAGSASTAVAGSGPFGSGGGGGTQSGGGTAGVAAAISIPAPPGWNGDWAWVQAAYGAFDNVKLAPLPDGSAYVVYTFDGREPLAVGDQSYVAATSQTDTLVPNTDLVVAKYAANGALLWARQLAGSGSKGAAAIVAAPDGSAVLTGHFSGELSAGATTLTVPTPLSSGFLARLAPNGDVVWANRVAGASAPLLATGPEGSFYLVGNFYESASFGATTLDVSNGQTGLFLAKYAADGVPAWARLIAEANASATLYASTLASAGDGTVFVLGNSYNGTASIGALSLDEKPATFLAKCALDGSPLWARRVPAAALRDSMATFADGSVALAAGCHNEIAFDALIQSSAVPTDACVAKLDPDGSFVLALQLGARADAGFFQVAVDGRGSVYAQGLITVPEGEAVTTGSTIIGPTDRERHFLAEFDSAGSLTSVLAGAEGTGVYDMKVSEGGALYLTGAFHDATMFGAITLVPATTGGTSLPGAFVMRRP